jgi:hypothetical protein
MVDKRAGAAASSADLFTLRDGKIIVKQALRKQRPLLNK